MGSVDISAKRRTAAWVVGSLLFTLAIAAPSWAYPRPGRYELASVSPVKAAAGDPTPNVSTSISGNGRYVAFDSADQTLVVPDLNPDTDIFVRDRLSGTIEIASVASDGSQAIGIPFTRGTREPVISLGGRVVAFTSSAANLVAGDSNNAADVFVHHLGSGTTLRVSVGRGGEEANGTSENPSVSANGRYVAFTSEASNIVDGDTNEAWDIFVHDLVKERTTRVSLSDEGDQIPGPGNVNTCPSLSPDGRFVAFTSSGRVVGADGDDQPDVYLHDIQKHRTEIVSLASDGTHEKLPGTGSSTCGWGGRAVGRGARVIAFGSTVSDMVPTDSTLGEDVFVHDRKTARTERISVTSDGTEGDAISGGSSLSADGRFVVFHGGSANLDGSGSTLDPVSALLGNTTDSDVFLHDRRMGTTEVISRPHGADAPECSAAQAGSTDNSGSTISFASCDKLVPGDENLFWDAYVRRRGTALGTSLSQTSPTEGDGSSVSRLEEADETLVPGADLLRTKVVLRPRLADIYVRFDVERLAAPRLALGNTSAGGNRTIVYVLRFVAEGETYELRAAASRGSDPRPAFGLFQCRASACDELTELRGGYGTAGESVIATIPLDAFGGSDHLTHLCASSALGSYETKALRVLDGC